MLNLAPDNMFRSTRTFTRRGIWRGLVRHGHRVVIVLAAAVLQACQAPPPARPEPPPPQLPASHIADFEPAEDAQPSDGWQDLEHLLGSGSEPPPAEPSRAASQPVAPQSFHTLVLQTFPGDRGETARQWHAQLTQIVPPLQEHTAVHVDGKGSMVVFGHYEGWDDPQAAIDMRTLQNLRVNDKRIFGAIMRTDVRPRRADSALHPHELVALRRRHPDVRTIYTLEIEVWGGFKSGEMTSADRRGHAERRVAELREGGVPAFFHHDPVTDLSTVTVGAFGEDALDPSSGLMSLDVEQWQHRFPNRLINGEELRMPVQGQPELGTVTQRSRLVLVPDE
ncbi:MAG: hypothetical protein QF733_07675 [Phycisphaerales bacterium]|jgi:hypothetical protein|nr:hypothetical protein [Phycisphaerales bacterium]